MEELVENKEVDLSHIKGDLHGFLGDFSFVVMEKFLSQDNELPFWEQIIMKMHFMIKDISLSEEKGFGLDTSKVVIEKFPLVVSPASNLNLKRATRN